MLVLSPLTGVKMLLTHVNLSVSAYTYSTDHHSLLSLSVGVIIVIGL
jgi:hypothetical protein